MRAIVNISLPQELMIAIKAEMKKRHFPSVSEFFRDLLRRHYEELEALADLHESEKELAEGKGKVLRSLKDLR